MTIAVVVVVVGESTRSARAGMNGVPFGNAQPGATWGVPVSAAMSMGAPMLPVGGEGGARFEVLNPASSSSSSLPSGGGGGSFDSMYGGSSFDDEPPLLEGMHACMCV
jgi:hypothetical protein